MNTMAYTYGLCTGCPFSSAWSTRSVCWFSSVFTRRHQSTLQWWETRFLPPQAEVISDLQHAAIWRYLDHEPRLTDKEVFPSLVRHCRTRCRSLFVTNLWQWHSSAHIWRLFCFVEHIVLSIAPAWQYCTGQAAAPPRPLLAVPNVTAHPWTANVPNSYHSMWQYNCFCILKV